MHRSRSNHELIHLWLHRPLKVGGGESVSVDAQTDGILLHYYGFEAVRLSGGEAVNKRTTPRGPPSGGHGPTHCGSPQSVFSQPVVPSVRPEDPASVRVGRSQCPMRVLPPESVASRAPPPTPHPTHTLPDAQNGHTDKD